VGKLLTQDFVPYVDTPGRESFIVSDYLSRIDESGNLAVHALTGEMEDAILELVDSMKKNGIAWEDFKMDAIYMQRNSNGKLVCGVIDVDRIAKWDKMTPAMDDCINQVENLIEQKMPVQGVRFSFRRSAGNEHFFRNIDEYWEFTLQRRRVVNYSSGTQTWRSGSLPIEKVRTKFPGFGTRSYLDFSKRDPSVPTLVPTGHTMLWLPTQLGYAA